MDILDFTGLKSRERADRPDVRIGTPAEPLYIPAESGFVKTGKAANQSWRDRVEFLAKNDRLANDKDVLLPAGGRRERRVAERSRVRDGDTATRRYRERQRKADMQANHLAQMFNLEKGLVPATGIRTRILATRSITRAVKVVVDEDRRRFDREFSAWVRSGKEGPAPKQPARYEEVRAQLENIALGATTRVPKQRTYDQGDFLPTGLTVAENRTGQDEVVL